VLNGLQFLMETFEESPEKEEIVDRFREVQELVRELVELEESE